jgi:hypothetical protein
MKPLAIQWRKKCNLKVEKEEIQWEKLSSRSRLIWEMRNCEKSSEKWREKLMKRKLIQWLRKPEKWREMAPNVRNVREAVRNPHQRKLCILNWLSNAGNENENNLLIVKISMLSMCMSIYLCVYIEIQWNNDSMANVSVASGITMQLVNTSWKWRPLWWNYVANEKLKYGYCESYLLKAYLADTYWSSQKTHREAREESEGVLAILFYS